MDERLEELKKKPLTKKNLLVAIATTLVLFTYIGTALFGARSPLIRLIMIGPYGTSAMVWLVVAVVCVLKLHRRDQRRRR